MILAVILFSIIAFLFIGTVAALVRSGQISREEEKRGQRFSD